MSEVQLIKTTQDPETPAGYKMTGGLLVPVDTNRGAEAWTPEEWNIMEKAAKLAVQKRLLFRLFCMDDACREGQDVAMLEMVSTPAGRVLRCNHLDRSLAQADRVKHNKIQQALSRRDRRLLKRKMEADAHMRRQAEKSSAADPGAGDDGGGAGTATD